MHIYTRHVIEDIELLFIDVIQEIKIQQVINNRLGLVEIIPKSRLA